MKPKFMWNHNSIRRGKLIQMIQAIFCPSLLSVPGRAGAFSRDFTTSLAPECRAFSGTLKIEKLKALLIPGPEGAVDTNDWCITGNDGYELVWKAIASYLWMNVHPYLVDFYSD